MKILLISGHGANDPGACSKYGIEREETRKVVSELVNQFKNYNDVAVDVYPTSRNAYFDVNNGCVQVNFANYDYVFEVHFNSANFSAYGTEIWVTPMESTTIVEKKVVNKLSTLGFYNRGVKKEYFAVITNAKNKGVSSALLEVCFISNQGDMTNYRNKFNQICSAVADGIAEGFNLTKKTVTQPVKQQTNESTTTSVELYRVRKTWDDDSSQIGAYTVLENAKDNCPNGYSVFDSKGNRIYPIIISSVYRIRKAWSDSSSQKGAYSNKDSAIDECKKYIGYSVYDEKGKVIYTTPQPTKKYVNLKSHMTSWRVYPLNKTAIVGNQCGTLNPSLGKAKGGLTYTILEERGNDVYVINTSTYGKVQIYCPNDNDGSVSNSPLYEFVN